MIRLKSTILFFVAICMAVGVRSEGNKITYFGAVEYLTYSDAFKEKEDAFNETVSQLKNSLTAGQTLTSNTESSGGVGFRVGALANVPTKGFQIGGSLGYIIGPSFIGNINFPLETLDIYGNPVGTTQVEIEQEENSSVIRLMTESKYCHSFGKNIQVRLGVGIGIANLHLEGKSSDQIGSETVRSEFHSSNSIKLTWEIGPAIAYVTENLGIELALTYSQVPSAKNTETFREFDWNPFGVRLGVEF